MPEPKATLVQSVERVEQLVDQSFHLDEGQAPLPSWIEISPVDRCNRKCVFCPKSDAAVAPDQALEMAPGLYRRIAEDLDAIRFRGTVMLAGYGEPMLSRRILDMVQTFAKVCRVEITTNGDTLSVAKVASLKGSGVRKIVVSLYDGPEQVRQFTDMFTQAGLTPDDYFLRDRWYGADQDFGVMLTNRAGTIQSGNQRPVVSCKCYYPHYFMMVDWNGDVFLCPQDWNRRIKMGNLAFDTVEQVWRSDLYRKHRQALVQGERKLHPCINCNANGVLHGVRHAEAWQSFYSKP
jgi:radical SAM protein with 4Fe4S-binding SPASM domain